MQSLSSASAARDGATPRRLFLVTSCLLALTLLGCGPSEQAAVPTDSAPTTGNAPGAGNAPDGDHSGTGSEGSQVDMSKPVPVVMETSKGTIELELYPDKAPITVENFVGYIQKGHFDGTIFHRVIPDFMIQGGGFTPSMEEKPTGEGIKNEGQNGLKNARGTIAMARTSDPNSATAQFFINVKDNDNLDYPNPDGHGYAVFGKVTEGMDVVDAIKEVPTTTQGMHENVPVEPVVIKSVKIKEVKEGTEVKEDKGA